MLCLVIALPAEARPLIAHYKLKGVDGHPYRLYTGDDLSLIVSGVGKIAASSAVAYQQALLTDLPAAWLNVGIAGHADAPLGTALLAHKIVDAASGKTFYPSFTSTPPCPTTLLNTVDQPETIYANSCAYDMEASGFCETAQRFATGELVHCLKVVSDNPQYPLGDLNTKKVEQLITAQQESIAVMGKALADLARDLENLRADPPYLKEILARWRFTSTQRHQLRGLLRRWQILAPGQAVMDRELTSLPTRDEVLVIIERRLRDLDLSLTG